VAVHQVDVVAVAVQWQEYRACLAELARRLERVEAVALEHLPLPVAVGRVVVRELPEEVAEAVPGGVEAEEVQLPIPSNLSVLSWIRTRRWHPLTVSIRSSPKPTSLHAGPC